MKLTTNKKRNVMSVLNLQKLCIDTLPSLDNGKAAMAFERAVRQVVLDCIDRPMIAAARTVTLQLKIVPLKEMSGKEVFCVGTTGSVAVRMRTPDHETQTLDFGVRENGKQASLLPTGEED